MHLVGFIIRIYHDTRSSEHQIQVVCIAINVSQRIKLYVMTRNACYFFGLFLCEQIYIICLEDVTVSSIVYNVNFFFLMNLITS